MVGGTGYCLCIYLCIYIYIRIVPRSSNTYSVVKPKTPRGLEVDWIWSSQYSFEVGIIHIYIYSAVWICDLKKSGS